MSGTSPRVPLEQRVAAALDRAGDLSGPELLEHICNEHRDDPDLVAEVTALLNLASRENPVLDSGPMQGARTALDRLHDGLASGGQSADDAGSGDRSGQSRPVPTTIGIYRVIRVVGEGGMGLVYEAEQPNPRRRVAIKVIGRGVSSRATLARFRNEAQVLGQLKHPGIAQIYEAATDPASGEAFFAMEYIDGPSLTQFVRDTDLPDRARVELVARVCDAVQHAHQKGVIHRDLKPGNILVESAGDGAFIPKVLDFGVAKLTQSSGDGPAESVTLALDAHRIVGTLGYMSPEQFESRPELLDTRSDVYSLGVVLFEVLAGRLPIEVKDLSITQAATRVRSESPAPLGQIRPALRGDLEAIASKALAKDREDRYSSAAELAADLRRFLNHEPIAARPPGTLYTIRKFARRNPALTLVSCGAVLALAAATVFSTIQYRRAEAARVEEAKQTLLAIQRAQAELVAREKADKANALTTAVKDFLIVEMIGAAKPQHLGYQAKVLDVIKAAEENVGKTFADSPEIEGEIRHALSRVYFTLGQLDKSIEQADKAIAIFDRLEGPMGVRRAAVVGQRAISIATANRKEEAIPALTEALALNARVNPGDYAGQAQLANALGNLLQGADRFDEAESVLRDGLALAEAHLPPGNVERLNLRGTYLAMLSAKNRTEEVAPQLEKLLGEQEAAHGLYHPLSLTTRNNLVNALMKLNRFDDAMRAAEPLVQQAEKLFPEGHPYRAFAYTTVANAFRQNKRSEEAARLAEQAVGILERADGDFGFLTERATEIAFLSHAASKDATGKAVWGMRFLACRYLFASENEVQSLKARLLENAIPLGSKQATTAPACCSHSYASRGTDSRPRNPAAEPSITRIWPERRCCWVFRRTRLR